MPSSSVSSINSMSPLHANKSSWGFFSLRLGPIHKNALPLLFLLLLIISTFDMQPAEAASWRVRADKKAMRNSLVRFGKRAYRPAGEAFVSAVDLFEGPSWLGGGREDGRPSAAYRAFYPLRQQQQQPIWAAGGNDDQRQMAAE